MSTRPSQPNELQGLNECPCLVITLSDFLKGCDVLDGHISVLVIAHVPF